MDVPAECRWAIRFNRYADFLCYPSRRKGDFTVSLSVLVQHQYILQTLNFNRNSYDTQFKAVSTKYHARR